MRSSLTLVVVLLLLYAGGAGAALQSAQADEVSAAPTATVETQAADSMPLGCLIRCEPTCMLGKTPQVSVAITNQTSADIYLVGSLDASDCQWRYPHCYFVVIGPDGKSVVPKFSRCKFMNTLREKDFVQVPAGKAFDPYQNVDDFGFFSANQLTPSTFQTAGEYRIRFVYSTKSDTIAEWGGYGRNKVAEDPKLIGMFQQVPKVEISSNEIKVTVVEPGK